MKKFIVLTMVVAMASLASAGLVVSGDGGLVASLTGEGNGTSGFAVFAGIVGTTDASGAVMLYDGSMASIDQYTPAAYPISIYSGFATTDAYMITFADTTDPFASTDGLLLTWTGIAGDILVIVDENMQFIDSYTFVPEPMTMALLGLGGLFLRRKK